MTWKLYEYSVLTVENVLLNDLVLIELALGVEDDNK